MCHLIFLGWTPMDTSDFDERVLHIPHEVVHFFHVHSVEVGHTDAKPELIL